MPQMPRDSIAIAVHRRPPILNTPAGLTLATGNVVGLFMRDILLTKQELEGLMEELLVSNEKPRGTRRVDDWLLRSADVLGRRYASELGRHFR
jgi:NADH dehydrogenase